MWPEAVKLKNSFLAITHEEEVEKLLVTFFPLKKPFASGNFMNISYLIDCRRWHFLNAGNFFSELHNQSESPRPAQSSLGLAIFILPVLFRGGNCENIN
jgi:hypothetical protein